MTRYAVVGAGIAGLAAAWELARRDPAAEITVFEPGRVGGKLQTSPFAGRLVDEGADAFLARVPWGRALCDELGLGEELVSPADGSAYVAAGSQLHRLPGGLVLGVPTDVEALRGSSLLSADAVERVAAEPALAGTPLAPDEDLSVGALIRARFGDEVLERLVDPLIGGINAGDSDRLSVRASVAQIADAASRSASLVEGLRLAAPAPPGPVFWAHPRGMGAIVDRLSTALGDAGVHFEHAAVDSLGDIEAAGVVIATPAGAAAGLVSPGGGGAHDAARLLRAIGHSSPVIVTIAMRRDDVRHPLDASGFLVPRSEGRLLTACSFATTKWQQLATDADTIVLRASAGRYGDDRAIGMDDDALERAVLGDLDALIGLGGAATELRISRWADGFPQYEPGHLVRVAAIEADIASSLPNVRLAGATYRGIGVPACIRSGREAATALLLTATGG
ncbi:MAG: protoporphyrinogen oxidase [Acidimicrobiales bacterium]